MRRDVETTGSIWTDARPPKLETLDGSKTCEVCVIGAGIAGLTTAYLVSGAGKPVFVVGRQATDALNKSAPLGPVQRHESQPPFVGLRQHFG